MTITTFAPFAAVVSSEAVLLFLESLLCPLSSVYPLAVAHLVRCTVKLSSTRPHYCCHTNIEAAAPHRVLGYV